MAVAAGLIGGISPLAYAQLTSEHDVQARLEKEGYQQVRGIEFGPETEGTNAKAVKTAGKQVSLVIDSGGNVMERK
jgi:hypothetical protein